MIFPDRQSAVLRGHGGAVHCAVFSSGAGQHVLTGSADRTVRLFNPAKAAASGSGSAAAGLIQTYSAHGHAVYDVAVSADNARFASVGGDRQVYLWDVAEARTLRRWPGHGGAVNCVAFGGVSDSVVVSGSFDATVRLWDARASSAQPLQVLDGARDSVSSVAVRGDVVVAGSVDGKVRAYDLRAGLVRADEMGAAVTAVGVSRDGGAVLVSSLDSCVRLMDARTGSLLKAYRGLVNQSARIRSALGLNDAVVASGSEDGKILVWDLLEGTVVSELEAHGGKVASAVAFNGTRAEWVSAGADGTAVVWGSSS